MTFLFIFCWQFMFMGYLQIKKNCFARTSDRSERESQLSCLWVQDTSTLHIHDSYLSSPFQHCPHQAKKPSHHLALTCPYFTYSLSLDQQQERLRTTTTASCCCFTWHHHMFFRLTSQVSTGRHLSPVRRPWTMKNTGDKWLDQSNQNTALYLKEQFSKQITF